MSRRRSIGSTGGGESGYEVGYGKPPMHGRFRPGQSGNPAGRRKGVRNLMTDVLSMLATPVKVTEGGRRRTRSTQQAMLLVLLAKALSGEPRALDLGFRLAQQFNCDAAESEPAQALAADDQAILDAYVAKFAGAAITPATAESPDDQTSTPGARPEKKAPK